MLEGLNDATSRVLWQANLEPRYPDHTTNLDVGGGQLVPSAATLQSLRRLSRTGGGAALLRRQLFMTPPLRKWLEAEDEAIEHKLQGIGEMSGDPFPMADTAKFAVLATSAVKCRVAKVSLTEGSRQDAGKSPAAAAAGAFETGKGAPVSAEAGREMDNLRLRQRTGDMVGTLRSVFPGKARVRVNSATMFPSGELEAEEFVEEPKHVQRRGDEGEDKRGHEHWRENADEHGPEDENQHEHEHGHRHGHGEIQNKHGHTGKPDNEHEHEYGLKHGHASERGHDRGHAQERLEHHAPKAPGLLPPTHGHEHETPRFQSVGVEAEGLSANGAMIWRSPRAHFFSCSDNRIDFAQLGALGGDLAEFALALAVLEHRRMVEPEKIPPPDAETSNAFMPFANRPFEWPTVKAVSRARFATHVLHCRCAGAL